MLSWFATLAQQQPTAYAILLIALVAAGGLIVGGLRVRGIGLGASAVLFVGLLAGCCAPPAAALVLGFIKDFGLVLFVFTLGLQLGPGFAASLRAEGLRLNLLAAAVVASGSLIAALALWLLPGEHVGLLGALSGAVTNTPSLGATQQALLGVPRVAGTALAQLPAIAYAVAYPGGIAGIILALLLLRRWLRVDPLAEARRHAQEQEKAHEPFARATLRVDNAQLDGLTIAAIPGQHEAGVTISRLRGNGDAEVRPASPTTVVHRGDRLLVVGPRRALDAFQPVIGAAIDEDLVAEPGRAAFARLVVTSSQATGQHLGALRLGERFAVTATRVQRSGVEMTPVGGLRLHYGDTLHVVGERAALDQAAVLVGNHAQELNHTHFAAIFLGLALGVTAGLVPIAVPGLPEPLRLGLAGGPLLVAIVLGRLGSLGRVVWHMPEVANRACRELGIALFLASVGLLAGPGFVATVVTREGAQWAAVGLVITMVPLLAVGWFARAVLGMDFLRISGFLAGSMTDPPALAFANGLAGGEAPATAYATVYPLSMLLRIVIAQVLVVLYCR